MKRSIPSILLLVAAPVFAAQLVPDNPPPAAAAPAVRVFDTVSASATPLTPQAIASRSRWRELLEHEPARAVQGDAVFLNDRLTVVLRRGARGAEVYSAGPTGSVLRAILAADGSAAASRSGERAAQGPKYYEVGLAADRPSPRITAFSILEHDAALCVADATFTDGDGTAATLRYTLKPGQPIVQTEARTGASGLRVEAPCRFVVMPDFFADDIVLDAARLPVAEADLPSDNVLLHMIPGGEAIVMTVRPSSEDDVRVALQGAGAQRTIAHSELRSGTNRMFWVAVLTAPGLWVQQEIVPAQAGQVIRLDWTPPFAGHWRVNWQRVDDLTDSWEMLNARADGTFSKPTTYGGSETVPANRSRWTTVLGRFAYPAWVDPRGQAYLQPLSTPALQFQGPALIYPLNRVRATALDTFTVLDVVRNTLGVGPCEYILDVEAQQSSNKGRATCSVRDTLNPIYAQKQQKARKSEIEAVLRDLMIFIRHIRGRIDGYVEFAHQALAYLAEQKRAHPELAEPLAELERIARRMDANVAARRDKIQTPEEAAAMVDEFRRTVLENEGEDAAAGCKRYTEAWVEIGGNQDELVGECRWTVKMIRQKAGLLLATDPRVAEVAGELRRRSQVALRNPAGHEGARH